MRLLVALATIGAGGTLIGLTGAASSASTVPHSTTVVTLQFWNAYNDVTETPVMNGVVIPSFESLNPGIKVVDDTLPYAGMLQKFIAASAAGDPPDLMRSDIAWVPQLASEGTLLETSAQPWFPPIKAAADPGPLSTNYWNGGYYGIPDDTNTQVFFWNKADFAAAHLSPPTTWSQMIKDAKLLTIPSKQQHGLGVDSTDIWNVGPYVWTDGGNFTNKALTTTTNYMDGANTENAVQTLVTLYKDGVIGSDFVGGSGSISGETGFPLGEYAMYFDGPWAPTTYKADKFTGYGTSLIPAGQVARSRSSVARTSSSQRGPRTWPTRSSSSSSCSRRLPSSQWLVQATWRRTRRTPQPRRWRTQLSRSSPSSSCTARARPVTARLRPA